jgi:type II secretory pathway component PulK
MVASNVVALDQARHSAIGAEQLGMLIVNDLVVQDRTRTTLAGNWNGGVRRVPMPGGGVVEARLRDGGHSQVESGPNGSLGLLVAQRA